LRGREWQGENSHRTGRELGNFVVDTGASYVALSDAYAKQLGLDLPATSVLIHTAGGIQSGRVLTLDSVRVEGLEATRVLAVVLPEISPGVDGLLGLSFLGRFDLHQSASALELSARK
jgi:aspartyl protease family protein